MAEIIDINVNKVVENVQITTTENITTVNINENTGSGAVWGAISGNLSNQTDLQDALDLKANVSELGAAAFSNDYNDLANKPTKADLVGGKIPASQLPAYVDDVLEFANLASFPATGESGKIYIAIDTNLTYRWGGSSYVVMSSSLALGETSSTAYRGDNGKIAYDHSQATGNPHSTTKADIGLGNVDNTSDLNKPISNATQNALNSKENSSNKVTDFTSPNNTTFPTTQAIINENKKATITVELINLLTTSFYAPNALRINSTALINGSGTITLKVNDVAYTLGNLIAQGAKITVETTTASVYNLIVIYE